MKYDHDPANAFPINNDGDASTEDMKEAQAFAAEFSNFCNTMSGLPQGIALDLLMREHRTIQQNMMRFCMAFIARLADERHDLRNEASVQLANQIMERTDYASRALPKV